MTLAPEPLLEALSEAAPCLVIGTHAVALSRPDLLDRPPNDTDLLTTPEALPALATLLLDAGFSLSSWEEPVSLPLPAELLKGRWYLRAQRGLLVLDLTYECPWLDMDACLARSSRVRGIAVAHLGDVACLMEVRGRPDDAERAARLRAAVSRPGGPSPGSSRS